LNTDSAGIKVCGVKAQLLYISEEIWDAENFRVQQFGCRRLTSSIKYRCVQLKAGPSKSRIVERYGDPEFNPVVVDCEEYGGAGENEYIGENVIYLGSQELWFKL
jgi:hypothetical protein